MTEFKTRIQKLTAEQIRELNVDEAQRIISENVNTLADVEAELFDSIGEYGKWKIKVEQLKSLKSTIVEMNRGLGKVVSNG